MATPLNQYNPVTGKREKIGGGAFQKATTPTLNKQMSDFSKSQGATTNAAGEWTNIPTQEQVSAFNKQFSTKTPIDMNMGENVAGLENVPYGFSSRQEPTVATPENPAVSKTMTDSLAYDPNNPEDYLMRLQARMAAGGNKPNETEYYNMMQAQKAMQKSQMANNPYNQYIDPLLAQQEQMRASESARDQSVLDAYKKDLEARYGAQREELLASGERQRSAAQNVYSFSGFGRSTAAADKMTEIQKGTDSAINSLNAAMQAEIAAKKAELEGADSETLAALNDRIQQYQNAAIKRQTDAIAKTAEANQASGASYIESINNMIKAAADSGLQLDTKGFEQAALAMQGMTPEQQQQYLSNFSEQEQLMLQGLSIAMPSETTGTGKNLRVWNPTTGKWEGAGGSYSGGGGGGGVGGVGGSIGSQGATGSSLDIMNYDLGPKAKDSQLKAKSFADRMNYSVDNIKDVEDEYINRSKFGQGFVGWSPEFIKPQNQKQFESYKQNFITASLRQESGATIADTEFEKEEKKYFPQVGDSLETVNAKRRARELAIKSMYTQAGIGGKYIQRSFKDESDKQNDLLGTQVNDVSGLPEGTIVEQDGIDYIIQGGKPVPVSNIQQTNPYLNINQLGAFR